jgi:hypothetical protein
MRLLSRLDDERKSGATWNAIFRQSPYCPNRPPTSCATCSRLKVVMAVFGSLMTPFSRRRPF